MTVIFILKITKLRNIKRILLFIYKRFLLRKQIPAVAILALTYKCQCRCIHCSAARYETTGDELSTESWKTILKDIAKSGNLRLHITGGEPLLKEGFLDIVEFACSLGFFVFIESNGEFLTEAIIDKLKSFEVNSIDISIDNADAKTHNILRNRADLFEKASKGIKLCQKHKIPVMLSAYATNENIESEEIFQLIDLARNIKADSMRIMPPQPSGKWLGKTSERLTDTNIETLRKGLPYFFTVLDRTPLPICPIKSHFTLFIAPDGEVHPCPHLPFSFGNANKNSIDKILYKMATENMFSNKNICYINDRAFVEKYIKPIEDETLPIKKY